MKRQHRYLQAWLCLALVLSGCHPSQPFYLYEDGDLSHYIDVATQAENPDLDIVNDWAEDGTDEPLTLSNSTFRGYWDVSLEEVVSITLQNNKVIRSLGQVRQTTTAGQSVFSPPDTVTSNPDFAPTIYDPAIQQTSNQGVEAALANFDAQLTTRTFWQKDDRVQNFGTLPIADQNRLVLDRDTWNWEVELAKRSAVGTQFFVRNRLIQEDSLINPSLQQRPLPKSWTAEIEFEARQPLLRNSGTQINRLPVMLARIREDISIADFEVEVSRQLAEIERAYWDLYFSYRNLNATRVGRDSALRTWQKIRALTETGTRGGDADREAQARERYLFFEARLKQSKRDLLQTEKNIRWLMGLVDTDGRILRPKDEPTIARVVFDWQEILNESLVLRADLRRQRWRVKQREMQLKAAKNQLLPELDMVALYRFVGLGEDLTRSSATGIKFPNRNSSALEELTRGDSQEYRVGAELNVPIGLRAELAAVREQQLQLRREKDRLFEAEREVRHQLSSAISDVDANYQTARTNFQRLQAAEDVVGATEVEYRLGLVPLDLLLQAQQSQAEAEIEYYRSLVQYNLSIVEVHRRKGSLLAFNNIMLDEGPWPAKAYFDAMGLARQRDASYLLNYGYTRPRVISRGPVPALPVVATGVRHGGPASHPAGAPAESIPTPAAEPSADSPDPAEFLPEPPASDAVNTPSHRTPQTAAAGPNHFDWGSLGLEP